jgi:Mg2+-importing ATPase
MGQNNEKIFLYAYLNATFETGYRNPIDKAIKEYKQVDDYVVSSRFIKLDEIPYDFIRKRLSILVSCESKGTTDYNNNDNQNQTNDIILITKGAVRSLLGICSFVETADGKVESISAFSNKITDVYRELGDRSCI